MGTGAGRRLTKVMLPAASPWKPRQFALEVIRSREPDPVRSQGREKCPDLPGAGSQV